HEGGGECAAHLESLDRSRPPIRQRLDRREALEGGPLLLPDGDLRDVVLEVAGDIALRSLFTLRRYLTPRIAHAGNARFGMLSFDVVVFEVPGGRVVSNEVEVHVEGDAAIPDALDRVFREHGLEPASRSAFERAVLRVRRSLDETALVLPDERLVLEGAVREGGSLAPIAQVILLDERGFRPDTIATQTGLGMARVRQVRERFREVRLSVLEPLAPMPLRRSFQVPAPVRRPAPPPSVTTEESSRGDGSPLLPGTDTLDDLLDLFEAEAPDTPLFGDEPADDEGGGAAVAARPTFSRRRYPVVLGPVATPALARRPSTSFSEVNLATIERSKPAPVDQAQPERLETDFELHPETPLLAAAHSLVDHRLSEFETASTQFLLSRAPSDARPLVVSAHGVRLALESFRSVLPQLSAQHLVVGLRPLVSDLDAALDYSRAALAAARSVDAAPTHLGKRARWALDAAAARLRSDEHFQWQNRARRLLARVAAEAASGLSRSDDSGQQREDYVGAPLSGAPPTRLHHILGSQLWSRFEAIRVLEDDLDAPTAETARRLSVAISGLLFVLEVVAPIAKEAGPHASSVVRALRAAEESTVSARQKAVTAGLLGVADREPTFDGMTGVWRAITSPAFRSRLGAIVQAI
ncbi:hypothetical protein, partial [Rubrivirga sp.]|uniref:hypothetical protein n=1 Tax=Rubrivirga sp. TaxID=1885344 RepID=UPI003C746D8D